MPLDTLHIILDIVSALAIAMVSYIGLLIRSQLSSIRLTQAEDKADLVRNQNEVKEELTTHQNGVKDELTAHYSELKRDVAVHVRQDEVIFAGINQTLGRFEAKLDRLSAAPAPRR